MTDSDRALVSFLSWDTEGGDRAARNLLRSEGVHLRLLVDGNWQSTANLVATRSGDGRAIRYSVRPRADADVSWEIRQEPDRLLCRLWFGGLAASHVSACEMVFAFDPRTTPTTLLASGSNPDGTLLLPAIISAPDFGQMLLECSTSGVKARLDGSRERQFVDLVLELEPEKDQPIDIRLSPVRLDPPAGLSDTSLWSLARRGWFNAWQPTARWGSQGRPFSAPPGILANNVISDPASFSLTFYADHAFWTPTLAKGISVAGLARRSLEFWLDERMRTSGEVVGYWDYGNFLDSNSAPPVIAWDYAEATGDLHWLEPRIEQLETVADFAARRDQDHDGLIEATQSGNANTLLEPDRSCCWFDAVNHGHKDGYSNALIYRGWRCLADLEGKLGRKEQQQRYLRLSDRLKVAYAPALYNPATGWLGSWKSDDGALHDYASPVVNGLAVEYGLVDSERGRAILDRLWQKLAEAGFKRFDLGLPSTLLPVRRSDYLQPHGFGCPAREDGTDTFQQYQNGGITAGQILHFLAALYRVGQADRADAVLRSMLTRQQQGGFQNGVQNVATKGADWTTWAGEPCGYEGFLADVYYFLQAVLLRESSFRARYYRPLAAQST